MANTEDGYDRIASEFAEFREADQLGYTERYTIRNYMLKPLLDERGFLTKKRILDLACGHGHYTRQLKALKCAYILGVDLSSEMIKLARDVEQQNPQGIDYMVADVKHLPIPKQSFDLVTGFYLLNYAQTRNELLQMARNIFAQLDKNSQFIGTIGIPLADKNLIDQRKYGFTKHVTVALSDGCIPDGTEFIVTLYDTEEKAPCTFTNYHYSLATYEQVFKEADFKSLKWIHYQCDPNIPNKAFYDDYFKYPSSIGLIVPK